MFVVQHRSELIIYLTEESMIGERAIDKLLNRNQLRLFGEVTYFFLTLTHNTL